MIDRRRLILGAGLSFAAMAMSSASAPPALAQSTRPRPLRPDGFLQLPKFSDLADEPTITRLRPHREGGVNCDVDRAPDLPNGKVLIHNYGHGGGGITLAWGCADRVRQLVSEQLSKLHIQPARARIAVVGAGVAGLTVADELKRWTPAMNVIVYAQNVDPNGKPILNETTSWYAGGQFEPSGIWREYDDRNKIPELHALVTASHKRILALKQLGRQRLYGVVDRKNYTLAAGNTEGFDIGVPRTVIPAAREGFLPFEPLRRERGKEYSTWLINPRILLPRLVADLQAARTPFLKRDVQSKADLVAIDADIVINCTGLWSKAIDSEVRPIRGQLVFLKNRGQLKYMFSGGCGSETAYMFARQDDIVIGGTYHDLKDVPVPPIQDWRAILGRMQNIFENGDVSDCTFAPKPVRPKIPCAQS